MGTEPAWTLLLQARWKGVSCPEAPLGFFIWSSQVLLGAHPGVVRTRLVPCARWMMFSWPQEKRWVLFVSVERTGAERQDTHPSFSLLCLPLWPSSPLTSTSTQRS